MSKSETVVYSTFVVSFLAGLTGLIIMAIGGIWDSGLTYKIGQSIAAIGGIVAVPAFLVSLVVAS